MSEEIEKIISEGITGVINGESEMEAMEHEDLEILFILEDGEFGYAYVYKSDSESEEGSFKSNMYQDRFSKELILNPKLIDILGDENRTMYVGDHSTALEALNEALTFWSGVNQIDKIGEVDPLSFDEAIEKSVKEGLAYIIFKTKV
jgi:hypothetical protein